MIDYNLSKEDEKVLDALQMQEYKSVRMLVLETGIFHKSVKDILISLMDKGLAAPVNKIKGSKPTYWSAL